MKTPSPFIWWDMWMEGWSTGFRLLETMAAVPQVVSARMPMIGAAACDPMTGDWPELYRMVAEKVEAFTLAGLSMSRDMQALQADLLTGRDRSVASSARIGRRAIGAAGRALAPVHAAATGNAKRLGRRKSSRS